MGQKLVCLTGQETSENSKDETFLQELSDAFLLDLSEDLGTNWDKVGYRLGMSQADIDRAKANHQHDMTKQAHSLLIQWRQQTSGEQNKRELLATALRKAGCIEIAEKYGLQEVMHGQATTGGYSMGEGQFQVSQILSNLKTLYKRHSSHVNAFPWLRESVADLKEHFCTLHLVTREERKQLRQSKKDASIPDLLSRLIDRTPIKQCDIFSPDKYGEPRRILVEGEPGIGKTSLCVKLAIDWSREEEYIAEKFEGVFFIRARDIKTGIQEYMQTTLCMTSSDVEQVWKSMLDRQYQNRFLFIIDGLDEVVDSLPNECVDLIKGRLFFNSCVFVTSRTNQWQSKLSSTPNSSLDTRTFDREIVNVGFKQKIAFEFIDAVGVAKRAESQIETLQQFIRQHEFLDDLIRSPLICIFLCIMWNENYVITGNEKDEFRRTLLYTNMVECLVKRYCQQTRDPLYKLVDGELSPATKEKLGKVYKVAYCALQEGKVQISLCDVRRYLEVDHLEEKDVMFSFGILVKETDFLGFSEEVVYAFPHRTVQEELSSEYYVVGMSEEEKIVAAKQIVNSFPLMCIFSSGLVFQRDSLDPALIIPLFNEMANNLNNGDSRLNTALESVFECGDKTILTKIIAEKLPEEIELERPTPSTSAICGLLKCLNHCKTFVEDVLIMAEKPIVINVVGMTDVFKNNTELRVFDLYNGILKVMDEKKGGIVKATDQNTGWEALGEALKVNTALTQLDLSMCKIADRGWEALGEALKVNTALTKLNLSQCKIADRGWEALGEALKVNTAVTQLDLRGCEIADRWEALGEALKVNTALTQLHLRWCKIADRGWEALGEALKVNTAVTELDLSQCKIADRGWEALGEALKVNTALTQLDLNDCEIADRGWEALGEALKVNTALTQLDLSECKIPNRGWEALGEALKVHTALTQLDLRWCKITDRGWEALGKALKVNTALTQLDLGWCDIPDRGWEALGEALKANTVLRVLGKP